ncbi:hypothetical protein JRO89_XS15G0135700 [Xanthoceras sorbifolium]|uniref:Retrotransposon Copia-like N-terminal domain-containing protein n=1 Tax=Xanthoceras sorbifolium TaxID=99658 RepID=A0ABQ8H200_9ROSI|nr:hypothetical protein JRO89_XS15G0135700 [Xanthoceras sorbifolium]
MANDEVPSTPPLNFGKTAASSGSSKPEFSSNSSKSDISNPYFTHHSDHPGLVLVSKSLNGDNYSSWKRAMTLALNSKNKLGFVNCSIEAPSKEADPEGYATWSQCNDMIHSWIVNALNPEITDSVIYYSTTHEVWEDLHERFSQSNAPRVNATHGAQTDQQKLMQFLIGLNETYSAIRGQILLMNPLLSILQAYPSEQIAYNSPQRTDCLNLKMFDRKENDALTRIGVVLDQEGDDLSALIVERWVIGSKSAFNYMGTHQESEVSHNVEVRPTVLLSETQLKQLLSLLNNQDEGSSSKANAVTKPGLSKIDFHNWIIDSGAMDHITSSSKLLY